jgi:3-hydroxybutyryl-CoA dehydrogenase
MASVISSSRHIVGLPSRLRLFSTTLTRDAAPVKRLGVVGAGQMVYTPESPRGNENKRALLTLFLQGLGIALVAAQKAQVPVTLVDSSQKSLDRGIAFAGW